MLKVIIADDATMARARLRRMLASERDVEIIAECETGTATVDAIMAQRPDLVFLDIQMPELSGFQVLDALGPGEVPHVVFVTAFDEHALRAFAVDALDYLLKPFDAERLQLTLRRARERLSATVDRRELLNAIRDLAEHQRAMQDALVRPPLESSSNGAASTAYIERVSVRVDGRVMFVRVRDIDFFESAANYIQLHTGGETFLMRERMSELAAKLNPHAFARIHRCTIVNIDCIKEIQPWFSGDAVVIMRTGQKLRMSRNYRDNLAFGAPGRS